MSTKERESSGSGHRDAGPPSYVARPPDLTEHRYQLEDSKGRPWLWLTVKSRSREARQLPLFFERDTITGTVEADLDKAEGSKGVLISVGPLSSVECSSELPALLVTDSTVQHHATRPTLADSIHIGCPSAPVDHCLCTKVVAAVTAVGQEEIRFLDVSAELWNAKSAPSKLTGKQTWPFSITLPAECVNPERGKSKQLQEVYSLPPTFSERASPAYIDYKLVATVRKGSFRVNQTLATSIVYLPMVRAEPPSPLRQLAYREGSGLVGPDGDPDGWKVLTPVTVMGTIFGARQVELQCTVAVAKPLIYALGSPIPIIVTLRGSDEQALDVLATPSSVRMHLLRVRLVGSHAVQEESTGRSNNVFREIVGTAFFWPSDEGAPQPGVRVLQGELEVKKSLKLGFVFPRFSLRYMLALLPFRAPGFAPAASAGPDSDALLTERVSIASVNAPGVVPRSYAPPGYVFPEEGDYNTAVGYLENGNQRFYNHHHGF